MAAVAGTSQTTAEAAEIAEITVTQDTQQDKSVLDVLTFDAAQQEPPFLCYM